MTKPIVGVAMMMLYEEGRYSLSDPVSMHIPEFADPQVYAGVDENGEIVLVDPEREATILDLMQHTAGFTYGSFGDTPVDRLYREREIGSYDDTLQDLIDKLADTPLLYQPGDRFVYSYAADIQGYLIEKWTGESVETFLRNRILDPLDMDQTIAWAPPDKAPLLANIYTHDNGQLKKFEGPLASIHFRAPGGFSGGGQLISTADDYWRFAQMLLNGGEFEGRRYLSPKTVQMMSTDRLMARGELFYSGAGFGLNFAVISRPTEVPYPVSDGEYFWAGLANTIFWIDPEEDLIVIMLTQYLPFNEPYFRDLMHRMVHAAIID
jgi:CubicO group peptidase (beta-lactamase class C family)